MAKSIGYSNSRLRYAARTASCNRRVASIGSRMSPIFCASSGEPSIRSAQCSKSLAPYPGRRYGSSGLRSIVANFAFDAASRRSTTPSRPSFSMMSSVITTPYVLSAHSITPARSHSEGSESSGIYSPMVTLICDDASSGASVKIVFIT